ncbi:ATP-grasp domain-containing protein [Saccharothrix mutabilis subsp. mutabilis]|uniref:ATP-grasp domain-containing protein n=1 Tax=Saccharothrix mutabilis subsp. mutabilis TaxID=66855 RepID=A0ABN0U7A7_9PSEU
MKLLAIEARQNATYYQSRYRQVVDFGADLFVLNGEGTEDFWPADRYRVAGSKHIDAIIETAKAWHAEERFDGVFAFAEAAVVTVAAVGEALGLPTIGVDAALNSRNKILMRRAHEKGGAAHPDFRFAADVQDALQAAEDFGYPVILKPTLGAGSYYVFRCDDPDELRERFAVAAEGIRDMPWVATAADGIDLGPNGLIVESFLDGHEHLIEALAWDDEVYLGNVVDRVTEEGDTFDDDVHHSPTTLSPEDLAAVHEVVKAGAHAQGIRRSALHAEVRFHQGKPYLLEIAVRVGGGGLDYQARASGGYDPIKAVMDVARGVKPDVRHYTPTGVHVWGNAMICDAGTIKEVVVPQEVEQSDKTLFLKITAKPGTVILRPPDGNSVLGFLLVTGDSYEDVQRTHQEFSDRIQVVFEEPGEAR